MCLPRSFKKPYQRIQFDRFLIVNMGFMNGRARQIRINIQSFRFGHFVSFRRFGF